MLLGQGFCTGTSIVIGVGIGGWGRLSYRRIAFRCLQNVSILGDSDVGTAKTTYMVVSAPVSFSSRGGMLQHQSPSRHFHHRTRSASC